MACNAEFLSLADGRVFVESRHGWQRQEQANFQVSVEIGPDTGGAFMSFSFCLVTPPSSPCLPNSEEGAAFPPNWFGNAQQADSR